MSTPSKPVWAQKSRRSLMESWPARRGALKEKALRLGLSFLAAVAAGPAVLARGVGVSAIADASGIADASMGMPAMAARKDLRCIWQVLGVNLGKLEKKMYFATEI